MPPIFELDLCFMVICIGYNIQQAGQTYRPTSDALNAQFALRHDYAIAVYLNC